MEKNKTGKYLKYAIGEIVLVVIGILIALSINNWNENRKTKQFEHKILNDIKSSLQDNLFEFRLSLNCNKNAVLSANLVLNNLNGNLPYNDSLDVHFSKAVQWCTPTLYNGGYESLKTYGVNLVTNDSIRDMLGIFDGSWIPTLGRRQEEYFYNTASPILAELFDKVAMRTKMKPFKYDALKNSNKFISVINTSIALREDQIKFYSDWLESLIKLDKMIDIELKKQ